MEIEKRDQLSEYLRTKLIESGWRNKLTTMCRESIHKHGVDNVSLREIIDDVSEEAKHSVPESIKNELLDKIRTVESQFQQLTTDVRCVSEDSRLTEI